MDRGAWWAAVHGVAKSQIQLSDLTFTFHFHALEKEMATHSSVLAWRVPGTGEPGVLPSMGSHRVGHDWSDLAAAAAKILLKPFSWMKWDAASFERIPEQERDLHQIQVTVQEALILELHVIAEPVVLEMSWLEIMQCRIYGEPQRKKVYPNWA